MRESKRSKILAAAVEVVQREGVTAVTFESVAAESGLTKGGLLYHFPTRVALLLGVHQHVAREWDRAMTEAAGKSAAEATAEERLAAYARVASRSGTRADLLLSLEASINPVYAEPWIEVMSQWAPSAKEAETDPAAFDRFIARLAADGLWMYEALTGEELAPALRQRVSDRLAGP